MSENDVDLVRLGRTVRELRHKADLSLEELAFRAGMHPSYLQQIEAGKRSPGFRKLLGLTRALGVEPSIILPPPSAHLLALGSAIRSLREEHVLTVDELAATACISTGRLTALEDGRLDPDLDLLWVLADGLGVRLAELFRRAEDSK